MMSRKHGGRRNSHPSRLNDPIWPRKTDRPCHRLLSFYVSARRALLNLIRRNDVVVAMTDPLLISIIAMQVAQRRQARLINWLQDIYPEVALALRIPFLYARALG
jgi:hypothetical protein